MVVGVLIALWFLRSVTDADSSRQEAHWAFQPLAEGALPAVEDSWPESPVDTFVRGRLREHQLSPSPETDRRTLIRRAFLILHGLPPTPERVDAFVRDLSPEAYPRLVDELLASPRYGERWAQHWLDLVRFAESTGYEVNGRLTNAYHYRDYVIRALNEDRPYDRFVFEQIAGDSVGEDAATGFLIAGPYDSVSSPEERLAATQRQDRLDEMVKATGAVFLGLTIACGRCHDHKFDPISQKDYYAVQAVFAGTDYGDRRLRGAENDRWQARLPDMERRLEAAELGLEQKRVERQLRSALGSPSHEERFPPVEADAIRLTIHSTHNNSPVALDQVEVWSVATDEGKAENIALASVGGRASSSSYALAGNQSRQVDNVLDGRGTLNLFWWALTGDPQWVRIDFAKRQLIDRVIWIGQGQMGVPAECDIEVKKGRGTWYRVAHTRDRLPLTGDARPLEKVRFEKLSAEEVRELAELSRLRDGLRAERDQLAAGPQAWVGSFSKPEIIHLRHRGDALDRREVVTPNVPALLGDLRLTNNTPEQERRVAFARRLTAPNGDLAARVLVNRIWQHYFGTGIVDTPSDFGLQGSRPTHPVLLDWLARDLIRNGWSIKRLHRQILLSGTFRQSSAPRRAALAIDSDSRYLWRFPPRRLDAEVLRDSILCVSGALNFQMGGPGFDFFQLKGNIFSNNEPRQDFGPADWRRMIYGTKVRLESVEIFGDFDCPNAGQMAPARTRSTTPIQALSLFNSGFIMRQSNIFAQRLRQESEPEIVPQLQRAAKIAIGRSLREDELELFENLSQHGLEQVCRVLFNSSEFLFCP